MLDVRTGNGLLTSGWKPRAGTDSDLGPDWDREIALAGCQFALAKAREALAPAS
jgi:hypothetical protein